MAKHKYIAPHGDDLYEDIEKIKAAILNSTEETRIKASEMLTHTVEDVKKQSHQVKEKIIDHTTEKPLQSLGIALLIGIAIGIFVRK